MEIWAHRGASAEAPENTMPAFQLAAEQGADAVEFDVHRTRDGHLVVIHDETIERTSNGRGSVARMSLAELRRFDFGSAQSGRAMIPTLFEVLDWLPESMTANIELKTFPVFYEGIAARAVEIIRALGMGDRVWVSSFNHRTLSQVRQTAPELHLGALVGGQLWRPSAYLMQLGAGALHPPFPALQEPQLVAQCHRAGLRVHVWTVDDPGQALRCAELGVDAVITNHPGAIRAALAH